MDRQTDGRRDKRTAQRNGQYRVDGWSGESYQTDGRTDRADGRREQADVQRWTGRTEGRMGERTEGLNRLTKWTLSEWTGLLCFWIGFLKFGSFRFISFEKTN